MFSRKCAEYQFLTSSSIFQMCFESLLENIFILLNHNVEKGKILLTL